MKNDGKRRFKTEYLLFPAAIAALALLYQNIGCPFRFLFGVSCPGCGMVRAAIRCCKADFAGAWHLHPLVFALPVFALGLFLLRKKPKATRMLLLAFAGCLAAVYVYRIASGAAPDVVWFQPERGLFARLIRLLTPPAAIIQWF